MTATPVARIPSLDPKTRARLESLIRKRLAALDVQFGNARRLIEICRDKKCLQSKRCEAAELLGLLELMGVLQPRMRSGVVHALLQNIREDNSNLAWCSAVSIGYLGRPKSVGPLLRILKRPIRTETRRAVVNALGWLNDRRATAALVRILDNHREPAILRAEAAEALGPCGSRRAFTSLVRAVGSRSHRVRRGAAP